MSFATVRKAMNFPAGVAVGLLGAAATPRGMHYVGMVMANHVMPYVHSHPGNVVAGAVSGFMGLIGGATVAEHEKSPVRAAVGMAVMTASCTAIGMFLNNYMGIVP